MNGGTDIKKFIRFDVQNRGWANKIKGKTPEMNGPNTVDLARDGRIREVFVSVEER